MIHPYVSLGDGRKVRWGLTGRVERARRTKWGHTLVFHTKVCILGGIELISRNLSNDSARILESLSDFFLYNNFNETVNFVFLHLASIFQKVVMAIPMYFEELYNS